jgi:phospholipid transport system substrate-binding protein
MRLAWSVLFSTLLVLLAAAPPDRPLEQVRATAEKILSILRDPNLQGDSKRTERRKVIRQELERRFDWNTICRSCLGRHWSKLSRDQQREFMELFRDFLQRIYLDRIEPYYDQLDHIDYQGERILEGNYASVKTVVATKQRIDHPVEYRLEKSETEGWRVYDVVIEGVSLVKNYRTQFDEIITRSSYQGLVNDLKAKVAAGPVKAESP